MRGVDEKPNLETLQAAIRSIAPQDEAQRTAIARALQAIDELAQVRALVIAHTGSAIIMPLLVLLVFWFTVIMAGLNLFAPSNGTTWRSTSFARCRSRARSFSSSKWTGLSAA